MQVSSNFPFPVHSPPCLCPRMLTHSNRLPVTQASSWTWLMENCRCSGDGEVRVFIPLVPSLQGHLRLVASSLNDERPEWLPHDPLHTVLSPGSSYVSIPSPSSFCVIFLMPAQTFVHNPFVKLSSNSPVWVCQLFPVGTLTNIIAMLTILLSPSLYHPFFIWRKQRMNAFSLQQQMF